MCYFLSAIVTRDGTVNCDPEHTDSHEDLIALLGLDELDRADSADNIRRFVRVEFTSEHVDQPDTYELRLDEPGNAPAWWTDEMASRVADDLRSRIRRMIVSDKRKLLLGGCWILVGEAAVETVKNARIVALYDSSRVGELRGSSRVGALRGSSRVGELYDSSRVGALYDSSQVGALYDSSQVEHDHRQSRSYMT